MKNFVVVFVLLCITFPFANAEGFFKNLFGSSNRNDPNDNLDTLQMIRRDGYEAEAHIVQTEDGYLLTVHRIPGKQGSPAIFMQHGLLGSSADWVLVGRNKSLAYLLADQGYDIWFGNARGNTYSRGHISLSDNDLKFWDFSWHELGVYDLPAMINYVAKLKGYLKAYIGFSMGTTGFYVMATERPEMLILIKSVYHLAPVAYVKHIKGAVKYLSPIAFDIKTALLLLGNGEFTPQNFLMKMLEKYLCFRFALEERICANTIFLLLGFDQKQFNYALLPSIANHVPAGTSLKTVFHYAQLVESGYFRQYDYGPEKNMQIYNSTEPTSYDLSKITKPIVLFWAQNDWLSDRDDVTKLENEVSHKPIKYTVPFPDFNHIDFLWAVNVSKLVYEPLVDMINLQLIRKNGYPAEAHTIATKDGYLLTLHRIPGRSGAPAVYLQHGIFGSSADWVVLGRGNALAYLLADQGYDVWLGNLRGNTYSKGHISLSPKDSTFWDFSWHESGVYDLPATITHITDLKNDTLHAYVGYSMGSTCFFVMASERPQVVNLLRSAYSLAPVAYMKHLKSPARYLAPFRNIIKKFVQLIGKGEVPAMNYLMKYALKYLCYFEAIRNNICTKMMLLAVGFEAPLFNSTLLPLIFNHVPAGTSIKAFTHYSQEIISGYFRQYDYGEQRNIEIYNSVEPPRYNLSTIAIPNTFIYAQNDWLSNTIDVMRLANELPEKPHMYKIPYKKFNHIDYVWGSDTPRLVYKKLIDMMKDRL
ncbi:uncharacterized protein LOC128886773 [Hylaeus anthracinus]|uniref:uncharacterized protein LOC128886773 n=1 Tax=Hylaeus anthracinus TaxID=313031 RepID=UPI0023B96371|nr:uncharacterized protein LOC128886773 [Hylaeus anthracinus]